MKRKTYLPIILVVMFLLTTSVFAGTMATSIAVFPNATPIHIDGTVLDADNFNYKDTLYVPLRAVTENMGATVTWDADANIAHIQSPSDASRLHDYMLLYITATKAIKASDMALLTLYINDNRESVDYVKTSLDEASDYLDYINKELIGLSNQSISTLHTDLSSAISISLKSFSSYQSGSSTNATLGQSEIDNNTTLVNIKNYLELYMLDYIGEYEFTEFNMTETPWTGTQLPTETPPSVAADSTGNTQTSATDDYLYDYYMNNLNTMLNSLSSSLDTSSLDGMYDTSGNTDIFSGLLSGLPTTTSPTTPTETNQQTNSLGYVFPLHLYSNDGDVYLGKCVTDAIAEDGIYNDYSEYGNESSMTSIWNPRSTYGSKVSGNSAFNRSADSPPQIVDSNGKLFGYLTENSSVSGGYTATALYSYLLANGQ